MKRFSNIKIPGLHAREARDLLKGRIVSACAETQVLLFLPYHQRRGFLDINYCCTKRKEYTENKNLFQKFLLCSRTICYILVGAGVFYGSGLREASAENTAGTEKPAGFEKVVEEYGVIGKMERHGI